MVKRVLYLSVKKKWFDMIVSGEKTEEYRETSVYWSARLAPYGNHHVLIENSQDMVKAVASMRKKYTHVVFINGRNPKVNPMIEKEIEDIYKGYPNNDWCPREMQNKPCWVIKLK